MNKKLLSMMTVAVLSAASSGYVAANTGTLTFNGNVNKSSCVVSGLDASAQFPQLSRTFLQNAPAEPAQVPVTISVSSCPDALTRANIKFSYTVANAGTKRISLGDTEMQGLLLVIKRTPGAGGGGAAQIGNGNTLSMPIVDGTGSLTVYPTLVKSGAGFVAGAFTGTTDLVLSYN